MDYANDFCPETIVTELCREKRDARIAEIFKNKENKVIYAGLFTEQLFRRLSMELVINKYIEHIVFKEDVFYDGGNANYHLDCVWEDVEGIGYGWIWLDSKDNHKDLSKHIIQETKSIINKHHCICYLYKEIMHFEILSDNVLDSYSQDIRLSNTIELDY